MWFVGMFLKDFWKVSFNFIMTLQLTVPKYRTSFGETQYVRPTENLIELFSFWFSSVYYKDHFIFKRAVIAQLV